MGLLSPLFFPVFMRLLILASKKIILPAVFEIYTMIYNDSITVFSTGRHVQIEFYALLQNRTFEF